MNLFKGVKAYATVSPDGVYRYSLQRVWGDHDSPGLAWVMLNPSIASATVDDATLRKIQKWTRAHGYNHLTVVNLFAFRATKPRALRSASDPVGPDNDAAILSATGTNLAAVIAGWGNGGTYRNRAAQVIQMLCNEGHTIWRLGPPTSTGQPRHPLYVPDDTELEVHR